MFKPSAAGSPTLLIVCCSLLSIALSGCGGESDKGTPSTTSTTARKTAVVGAVVVSSSAQTLVVEGEPIDAAVVIRRVIEGDLFTPPDGYTVRVDDAFDEDGRLRFVVEPEDEEDKEDEDATRQAAADAFAALSALFAKEAEKSMRAELAVLQAAFKAKKEETGKLQQELSRYQASIRGLAKTKEIRLELRKYDRAYDQSLAEQIELREAAAALERNLGRQRWATLVRVR